jgi:plasmid stabilization system protein ParE
MSGYALHPKARFDLVEIWEFIGANNLDAANRVVTEVLTAIRALVSFPHRGHRRPDLTNRPLRFIRVRDYLIAYGPMESRYG